MRLNALPNSLHIPIYVLHMERKNTVQYHVLSKKNSINADDKFRSSGVYPLTYPDINGKYMGQTGRRFDTRLKEHLLSFKKNSYKSKLAQRLLKTCHTFGKMYDILGIVYFDNKWTHLNTVGKLYNYKKGSDGKSVK
jgi:hypothetical protein